MRNMGDFTVRQSKKALKRTLGSGRSHSGTLSTSSRASTIAGSAFRTSPALAWYDPTIRLLSEHAGEKVYLGRHRILGDFVEIHQAGPEFRRSSQLRRFIGEAQLVAQLAHPSIQPILGVAMGPDRAPALITRHVPGRTRTQFLSDARECLDRKEALPQQFRLNRRLEIGCKSVRCPRLRPQEGRAASRHKTRQCVAG